MQDAAVAAKQEVELLKAPAVLWTDAKKAMMVALCSELRWVAKQSVSAPLHRLRCAGVSVGHVTA